MRQALADLSGRIAEFNTSLPGVHAVADVAITDNRVYRNFTKPEKIRGNGHAAEVDFAQRNER
jgi:hypothetical protein